MAMAAGAAFADTEIASANIVGYQSFAIEANKWYLLGAQFEKVTGGAIDIQDFVKSEDLAPGHSENDSNCPQLLKYDGVGYVPYVYADENDMGDTFDPPQWLDSNSGDPAADIEIAAGESVWFFAKEDANISVAGQVADGSAKTVTIEPNKWNLIANPFPVAFAINGDKFDCSGLTAVVGENNEDAPQLLAYDGAGYIPYVYCSENDMGDEFDPPQWLDNGGDPTEAEISAGAGFWMYFKNTLDPVVIEFVK